MEEKGATAATKAAKVRSKAVGTNAMASGSSGNELTMFKAAVRCGVSRPQQRICPLRGLATRQRVLLLPRSLKLLRLLQLHARERPKQMADRRI